LCQHAVVFGVAALTGRGFSSLPSWFWINPLRALPLDAAQSPAILLAGMALVIAVDWILVALAFRRIRHARGNGVFAALAVVPFVQPFLIVALSLAPQLKQPSEAALPPTVRKSRQQTVMLGVLTGAALTVLTVAFSTLALRLYGYSLFLATPAFIGLTTAYIAKRYGDFGLGSSLSLVFLALFVGAAAIIGFAIEGFICLIMASPLIGVMGLLGGLLGHAIATARSRTNSALMSVAMMPLLLMGELSAPPQASFESVESVEVTAGKEAVWRAIIEMGPIPEPPPAPFRWGLAYPVDGQIEGGGVGAIRRGVFSTGIAYERVTQWTPGERLSFVVLSDPPALRELSPYDHVLAPHVAGYFRTADARFTITPLANGSTRLTLATLHHVDLEPALYWVPVTRWAVHVNKRRVLNHFRVRAEALEADSVQ
jgi:hypothetical protein